MMQEIRLHQNILDTRTLSYEPTRLDRKLREEGNVTLQIILKVTEVCNIACSYCYFFFGGDDSYKDNPAHISVDTIDGLCRLIKDAVERYGVDDILLIIHGGEPLMLKRDRMEYLLVRSRESAVGAKMRFTVQTNAMLLNEAWVELFSKYDVYVGVSLDGPEEINDINRVDKNGNGTYQRTLDGVGLLQQAARSGKLRPPGLLCVIPSDKPIEQIYSHFVDELGFTNLDFLLPIVDHDDGTQAEANLLKQQMIRLLELYASNKNKDVKIRFFDKAIKSLTISREFYTKSYRLAAQKDIVFVVSSAGDIGPDDTLRVNHPALMKVGLNVKTATLTDVLLNPILNKLLDESYKLPSNCQGCDFARVCGGGELYHRYSATRGFSDKSVHCQVLFSVYEALCEILLRTGYDTNVLAARLTAPPAQLDL